MVVITRKEDFEPAIDPWSHTSALSPVKKPGIHIVPPGREPDSHLTTVPPKNKVILIWTKWFHQDGYWDELPEGMLSCAQYYINVSCRITYNKKEYDHSDLVAFHGKGRDFTVSNLPNLSKRLPHQRWLYYTRESPINSGLLNNSSQGEHLNSLFNWTMTYRIDSDIDYRYARIVPGKTPDEYITQSGEIAVVVISNCQQQRLNYINELKKHIEVHVYGHCGTYKCPSKGDCFHMLKGKYRFYLAFENSMCKDYVTEKFYFNALQHNMLPIVINEGNFSDPTVAPPGCCINASDFKGAKELAEYIRMVDSNSALYSSYFKWHSRYRVQQESRAMAFCRTCQKLYTDSERKVYYNLYRWYGIKENCVPYPTP